MAKNWELTTSTVFVVVVVEEEEEEEEGRFKRQNMTSGPSQSLRHFQGVLLGLRNFSSERIIVLENVK